MTSANGLLIKPEALLRNVKGIVFGAMPESLMCGATLVIFSHNSARGHWLDKLKVLNRHSVTVVGCGVDGCTVGQQFTDACRIGSDFDSATG